MSNQKPPALNVLVSLNRSTLDSCVLNATANVTLARNALEFPAIIMIGAATTGSASHAKQVQTPNQGNLPRLLLSLSNAANARPPSGRGQTSASYPAINALAAVTNHVHRNMTPETPLITPSPQTHGNAQPA